MRTIPSSPEKILDAPDLKDDYYLNLMDWSASGIIAISLNRCVYLWNGNTGDIRELFET
jgi:cell division cycle 20, cofactor of APC complex